MKMNGTDETFRNSTVHLTLARRSRRAHSCGAFSQELMEDATMQRVKQASKQKRTTKAATVKALGAAGLGLSLANSASASAMPAVDSPQFDNTSTNQRFVLGEEEMADVSLATFHLFDRENFGSGVQVARGGCGGCGCGHGGGGCGGCGHGGGCGGVRGCGGGGGCVGIRGCGGAGFVGVRALRRCRLCWRPCRVAAVCRRPGVRWLPCVCLPRMRRIPWLRLRRLRLRRLGR